MVPTLALQVATVRFCRAEVRDPIGILSLAQHYPGTESGNFKLMRGLVSDITTGKALNVAICAAAPLQFAQTS
eukprot:742537-Rhodomonas_salina.3